MNYKKKYLKYKKKYELIKNKIHGGEIEYRFSQSKFSSVLNELNNTFLTYFVRDFKYHQADDVSDHSISTALVIAEWIKSQNKWVSGIEQKYHDVLVFSAFIHDIGKTGDGNYTSLLSSSKPSHHDDGVDIILGKKRYITYSNDINASLNLETKNPNYTDDRFYDRPSENAVRNVEANSINVETMFIEAGFTIQDLVICALIVGMVDKFEELIIDPIKKYELNPKKKRATDNTYITFFGAYNSEFNKLFSKIKNHHNINKYNKSDLLHTDKTTLTRMCLAISAANIKSAVLIEGTLDTLPKPVTSYPSSIKMMDENISKLFIERIEKKFAKYDEYYKYVDKILNLIKTKGEEKDDDSIEEQSNEEQDNTQTMDTNYLPQITMNNCEEEEKIKKQKKENKQIKKSKQNWCYIQ